MARILVIDDDPQIRRIVLRIVANEGHECLEAEDGLKGIDMFHATHPDLVITDMLMPEKEGIEIIRTIHNARPETRILAMSGGGHSGDKKTMFLDFAKELGANATIAKPFHIAELKEAVEKLLQQNLAA